MDGAAADGIDDNFSLEELTGWGDGDCVTALSTDQLAMPPTGLRSDDMLTLASTLKSTLTISPSSSKLVETVMILPVQDLRSPLTKPFAVFKYADFKPQSPQTRPLVADHGVSSPAEVSAHLPWPSLFISGDYLPSLGYVRDVPHGPRIQPVQHEPRELAARHTQQATSIKCGWSIGTRNQKNPHERPPAHDQAPSKGSVNQLCKKDKPTVRYHLAQARESSRRNSDACSTRPHYESIHTIGSHAAPNVSTPLDAPRRRSLTMALALDDDDDDDDDGGAARCHS